MALICLQLHFRIVLSLCLLGWLRLSLGEARLEPTTGALREACSRPVRALAAPIAPVIALVTLAAQIPRVIALMALAALGVFDAPFH